MVNPYIQTREYNAQMLKRILYTQSESRNTQKMTRVVRRIATELGAKVTIDNGNVYAVKGEAEVFPCMVAHTDTVHDIVPQSLYRVIFANGQYKAINPSTNQPTGIGGDDKVGIYIALSALQHFKNIKVAFFRDEEIGCQGAQAADVAFFEDVGYIIECDRKGNNDAVRSINGTQLMNYDFEKLIKPVLDRYKYTLTVGNSTDVRVLKGKVDVCMTNLSCGYYNPHFANEYIDRDDMMACKELAFDLIETLGETRHTHKNTTYAHTNHHPYNYQGPAPKFWEKDKQKSHIENALSFTKGVLHAHYCDECGKYLGMYAYEQEEEDFCTACSAKLNIQQEDSKKNPLTVSELLCRGADADMRDYMEGVAGRYTCPGCEEDRLQFDVTTESFICLSCMEWFSEDALERAEKLRNAGLKKIGKNVYMALPARSGY